MSAAIQARLAPQSESMILFVLERGSANGVRISQKERPVDHFEERS
jgi:hypothetical protein